MVLLSRAPLIGGFFPFLMRVQGTPGSTRAAATSYSLAHNISLNTVMDVADWSRSMTMFRHYMHLLPAEVLAHIASRSSRNVQDAVLDMLN